MITPQEVSQRAFSKASFGGYNMAQVDEFLDILTADYTTLYKENAVLKSKMKVLVEKVEEYRATEDAMRMTLLSAQKMASAMVAEAEEKKNAVIKDAEADARQRIAEIRQEVETEAYRLTAARNATAAYLAQLRELFDHEQDYLSHLSELAPPASPPPDPVETAAAEIEGTIDKLIEEEFPLPDTSDEESDPEDTKELDAEALSAIQDADPEMLSQTTVFRTADLTAQGEEKDFGREAPSGGRRIDFSNLQFGKDYKIK